MRRDYNDLTAKEKQAITSLQKLAKSWPKSLVLFSLSGTLVVMDSEDFAQNACYAEIIATVQGIPNDGGDR